ncbi:MAG: hypothetical protein SPI18_01460 [Prevotella sp.]|nr:hypothetical protein [Prevotella sp.]MDY6129951.1 hypothetical protein [Prevotella sp.]
MWCLLSANAAIRTIVKMLCDNFKDRVMVEIDRLRKSGVNVFDIREERGEREESKHSVEHLALVAEVTCNIPLRVQYAAW